MTLRPAAPLSLLLASCVQQAPYPKTEYQWEGNIGGSGTYYCSIDYVSPNVVELYPDKISVEEVQSQRSNGERFTDWSMVASWGNNDLAMKRSDQKGLSKPASLQDLGLSVDDGLFEDLAAATVSDQDPTGSYFHTSGYVQATCTIRYGASDGSGSFKLNGWYLSWESPCTDGRGWSEAEGCIGPSDQTLALAIDAGTFEYATENCTATVSYAVSPGGAVTGGGSCDWIEDVTLMLQAGSDDLSGTGTSEDCSVSISGGAFTEEGLVTGQLLHTYVATLSGAVLSDTEVSVVLTGGDPGESNAWSYDPNQMSLADVAQ